MFVNRNYEYWAKVTQQLTLSRRYSQLVANRCCQLACSLLETPFVTRDVSFRKICSWTDLFVMRGVRESRFHCVTLYTWKKWQFKGLYIFFISYSLFQTKYKMHHTEIRRALNNFVNRRHKCFFLIEGTLRYECFLTGFPELVTMAVNNPLGNLGCLLLVRLGRSLLKIISLVCRRAWHVLVLVRMWWHMNLFQHEEFNLFLVH
jgi:hypothetical protein